jgi:hypothetical protein
LDGDQVQASRDKLSEEVSSLPTTTPRSLCQYYPPLRAATNACTLSCIPVTSLLLFRGLPGLDRDNAAAATTCSIHNDIDQIFCCINRPVVVHRTRYFNLLCHPQTPFRGPPVPEPHSHTSKRRRRTLFHDPRTSRRVVPICNMHSQSILSLCTLYALSMHPKTTKPPETRNLWDLRGAL